MIYDLDSRKCLARNPVTALGVLERVRGMIGRKFDGFDAMVFPRCNAIHSCFMTQRFDAVFIDGEGRIVKCCESVAPWRLCLRSKTAKQVIELPEGSISAAGAETGHRLNVNMVLSGEEAAAVPVPEAAVVPAPGSCRAVKEIERE